MVKLVCIEGLDACGKETISNEVVKIFQDRGYSAGIMHFPVYETNLGKSIRDVLNGVCGDPTQLPGGLFGPLYTLNRIEEFRNKYDQIKDLQFLVLDRSFYSNFIYNASKLVTGKFAAYEEFHPDIIAQWLIDNYAWEFDCIRSLVEDARTFVLEFPSYEDQVKAMGSRDSLDLNETNKTFQNNNKQFVHNSMNPEFRRKVQVALVNRATSKGVKYGELHKLLDDNDKIMNYYFYNVEPITVPYVEQDKIADTAKDIATQIVNGMLYICPYGFINDKMFNAIPDPKLEEVLVEYLKGFPEHLCDILQYEPVPVSNTTGKTAHGITGDELNDLTRVAKYVKYIRVDMNRESNNDHHLAFTLACDPKEVNNMNAEEYKLITSREWLIPTEIEGLPISPLFMDVKTKKLYYNIRYNGDNEYTRFVDSLYIP